MTANGEGNRSREDADDLIIAALAVGRTQQEAADAAGVSARTVSRRLEDPVFKERIQTIRGEIIGQALGRMADGMTEAADVLRALLKADAETVRLGAARSLLDMGVRLREAVELQDKVRELETILKEVRRRNESRPA